MIEKPYHHGDLKQALVDAGIALLEEVGPEGLSLRAIAARVGVSHAAPQRHFDGVRGLKTAIAAEGFRRHAAFMRAGLPPDADRQARRFAAMQGYVRFATTHPHLFTLMFSTRDAEFSDPDLQQAGAESYGVLADIAEGLEPLYDGAPDARRRAEILLWAIVHGYSQLALTGLLCADENGPALPIEAVMPALIGQVDDPPSR
ncbi:TetR/AcrR family transcriptional regulator [Saliniramus fredricksonii]|nr:TetR/AcrR family transcriptional regulator [Saliniramus fredricksonii]